jgi:hypothetical protein
MVKSAEETTVGDQGTGDQGTDPWAGPLGRDLFPGTFSLPEANWGAVLQIENVSKEHLQLGEQSFKGSELVHRKR